MYVYLTNSFRALSEIYGITSENLCNNEVSAQRESPHRKIYTLLKLILRINYITFFTLCHHTFSVVFAFLKVL